MAEKPHDPARYVFRVADDIRRYVQDLLGENERLRTRETARRTEHERALHAAERLQEQIATLEIENTRLREEAARLRSRLEATDADTGRHLSDFVALERENSNLANLYVASYRLHGSVERQEVIDVLQEILANLVGTEEMVLLERDGRDGRLVLVTTNGIDPEPFRDLALGAGIIGRVAADGETFIRDGSLPAEATPAEANLTACIPLRLGDRITGVVAIFRLLPQKTAIEELDREIFDLLATHAATALYLSELHAAARGKGV